MDPFIGQLLLVPYNFAPQGWALCQGQLLAIRQNTALFSLLGTTYGGDGKTTFGLPNLQGSMPIGVGTGPGLPQYYQGQTGGGLTVTLTANTMPAHNHTQAGTTAPVQTANPSGATFALFGRGLHGDYVPGPTAPGVVMNTSAIGTNGGGVPHNNIMPSLGLNYIIALQGVFPSRQ